MSEKEEKSAEELKPSREEISRHDDRADIRYKFWHLTAQYASLGISFISLCVAILGILAVWSSLENNRGALEENTQSVRANVQNVMLTHVAALNKIFIDRPELYPYFYQNVKPPDSKQRCAQSGSAKRREQAPCYLDVLLAATSVADLLDIVDTQSIRFRDQWENPEAWDNWVRSTIRNSPILREYLRSNCRWYGARLIQDLKENEPKPEILSDDCEKYLKENENRLKERRPH